MRPSKNFFFYVASMLTNRQYPPRVELVIHATGSVSYTHLDVYKRQVVWLSGNWTLASVVGLADVVLGPLLNSAVASAWRHWRHARSHTELLGAGH